MKRLHIGLLLLTIVIGLTFSGCCLFGSGGSSTEISHNVTPTQYRIAVINLELYDGSVGSQNILNLAPDTAQVIDILPGTAVNTGEKTFSEVLNAAALVNGTTYDGFIMEPLYIEMELEAAFHFHSSCTESGYDLEFTTDGDEAPYLFRLYFNPVDNFWKRDIAVYLEDTDIDATTPAAYPSGWYWMRRGIEPSYPNFLILAQEDGVDYSLPANTLPTHPPGPAGSESVIDLFDNQTFWGDMANYDDYNTDTVEIDSYNDTGGLNIHWDAFTFSTGDTVTVASDVTDTFNFWYESDPAKLDFTPASNSDVIDFGPSYNNLLLGDKGFHPFMPSFTPTSVSAP